MANSKNLSNTNRMIKWNADKPITALIWQIPGILQKNL